MAVLTFKMDRLLQLGAGGLPGMGQVMTSFRGACVPINTHLQVHLRPNVNVGL